MENMYLTRKTIRKLPGKVMKEVTIPEPADSTISNLGYIETVEKSLSEEGVRYEIYDEINSEPKLEYIEAGRSIALKTDAKCIISLGGGSGMGAYHGEWGFREFIHASTVLRGSTRFNLPIREHPYNEHKILPLLRIMKK